MITKYLPLAALALAAPAFAEQTFLGATLDEDIIRQAVAPQWLQRASRRMVWGVTM